MDMNMDMNMDKNIEINLSLSKYTSDQQEEINMYIESLSMIQLQALQIAHSHLETSFDIYKSIGFKEWKKKQNETKK